jgi:GTP-binding protein Era
MTANANNTKCGFVALIGAPNAGKSCLLNALVGGKVSIVSPKVQTTRTRITGIITEKDTQAVFIDTPGIFKPRRRLDRAMVAAAHDARDGADIVAIIVDVGRKDAVQTVRKLLDRMPDKNGRQIILIMNKIDLSTHAKLLPLTLEMSKIYNWDSVFMISATRDNGVADIKTWILKNLPDSPFRKSLLIFHPILRAQSLPD